jgi:hypothetical protein
VTEKSVQWIQHLDDDVPGLEVGTVVDADVAAEGLSQVDRPSHSNRSISAIAVQDSPKKTGIGRKKRTRRTGVGRGAPGAQERRRSRGGGSGRGS